MTKKSTKSACTNKTTFNFFFLNLQPEEHGNSEVSEVISSCNARPYTNWKRSLLLPVILFFFFLLKLGYLTEEGKINLSDFLKFFQSANIKPFSQAACPCLQALLIAKEERKKGKRNTGACIPWLNTAQHARQASPVAGLLAPLTSGQTPQLPTMGPLPSG